MSWSDWEQTSLSQSLTAEEILHVCVFSVSSFVMRLVLTQKFNNHIKVLDSHQFTTVYLYVNDCINYAEGFSLTSLNKHVELVCCLSPADLLVMFRVVLDVTDSHS